MQDDIIFVTPKKSVDCHQIMKSYIYIFTLISLFLITNLDNVSDSILSVARESPFISIQNIHGCKTFSHQHLRHFIFISLFQISEYSDDLFIRTRLFLVDHSGLLNRPLVWTRKSVPTLFVRTSEISGLSEPGLTNHHCI